jgi:branched-chain amino acid transport system substrate-binding protein
MANDNAAGRQYMGGCVDGFKEKGGKVLLEQFPPLPTPDFAPYLSALKRDADVVMTWLAGPDTLNFLKSFYDFGLGDKMDVLLLMNGEFLRAEQMPAFGDKVLGITGLTEYVWRLDNPVNRKFVKNMETRIGKKPGPFHSRAYDAASIAIAALEATGGDTDPEKLRKAIMNTKLDTPSGPLSLNRKGIGIRNMYAVEIKKVEGEYSWVVDKAYRQFTAE